VSGQCQAKPNAMLACGDIAGLEADLRNEFVPWPASGSCSVDADCSPDTSCNDILFNKVGAAGAAAYAASPAFKQLEKQYAALGCSGPVGTSLFDPHNCKPVCTNKMCTAVQTTPSCDDAQAAITTLTAQFVDVAHAENCGVATDCVVATLPGYCNSGVVNHAAADGYASLLASPDYAQLLQREEAACGAPLPGRCSPGQTGTPVCTAGKCVIGTPADTCDGVENELDALRKTYVDPNTEGTCQANTDCVVSPTGSFCGSVVNKTAAAGYAAYLASAEYATLKKRLSDLGCGGAAGSCVNFGTPHCVSNQCVGGF
jgi:hypothetical protein